MVPLLKPVEHEMPHGEMKIRFGWPMSSWLDRLSIGVMIFNLMRLPRIFPGFHFEVYYPGRVPSPVTPPEPK